MSVPAIRLAEPRDLAAIMTILDAGMLDEDADGVRERIADGDALVAIERGVESGSRGATEGSIEGARRGATEGGAGSATGRTAEGSGEGMVGRSGDGERVLGVIVLVGSHVAAVAVRPGRRGQGIGSALVTAAARRRGRLTATFDDRVAAFYEALGFEIEPIDDDRARGVLRGVRE